MGSSNLGITNSAVDLILLSQWKVNQSIKCRCCWKTTVLVTLGLHPNSILSWSNLKKSSKLPVFNRSSLSLPGFASGFLPTPSWNAPLLPVNAIRKENKYTPWKFTWQWKKQSFENVCVSLYKMVIFHCHVNFQGSKHPHANGKERSSTKPPFWEFPIVVFCAGV